MKKCLVCQNELGRNAKKYCSNDCQIQYQYENYIKEWKENKKSGARGELVSKYVEKYLRIKFKDKCCKCGWDEKNPITNRVPIQINHIDGNYENNSENNLELICPNCHSLTSTYCGLNKGNGRKYRYKRKSTTNW